MAVRIRTATAPLAIDAVARGVDNTGATDAAAALATIVASATDGTTVFLRPGTYMFSSATIVELPDGVILQGAGPSTRIVRAEWTKSSIIRASGTYTATAQTTLTVNAAKGARTLTVASTTGMAVGDWYILGADTKFTASGVAYKGEYVRIKSVDSGTAVTLWGRLRDDYTTATSAALRKVVMHEGGGVRDLAFDDVEPGVHPVGYVEARWARGFRVENVDCTGAGGMAIYLAACVDFHIKACTTLDQPDNTGTGLVGYGINVFGPSENGVVDGFVARRGRHAFTTTGGAAAYGVPRNITVSNGIASEMTAPAWDTHADGADIRFVNCTATGCIQDGFQLRCPDAAIIGGGVSFCGSGVRLVEDAHRARIGGGFHVREIHEGGISGQGHGIRLAAGGTMADIIIDGVTFQNIYNAPIHFAPSDGGVFTNEPDRTTIRNVTAIDGSTGGGFRGLVYVDDNIDPTNLLMMNVLAIKTASGSIRAVFEKVGTALAAGTFIDCYTRGITTSGILSGVATACVRRNVRRLDYADPMRIESGIFMTSKAGAIGDADFPAAPADGTVGGIDVTNHRIYVRSGGVWKYAALT